MRCKRSHERTELRLRTMAENQPPEFPRITPYLLYADIDAAVDC